MGIVFNSALGYLMQTISIIQIAFHIPLMNINFPANALTFFKIVIPFANYDLLGSFDWFNDALKSVSRLTVNGEIDEDFDT